jgi:alpha-tubulin suppressor-like RCC1 family protein
VIGCGSDTTYPPTVASVQVTPGTDSLTAIGQTHQFTAVVKDQYGNVMAGKTVVWLSSLRLVATIDPATGVVTAVGNGTTMITATVDFYTGQAVLTVVQRATKLIFIAVPFGGTAGWTLSPTVKVEIEDAAGARVATATDAVTLAFGTNPSGAAFVGTPMVAAAGGIATFSGLAIDKAGAGFTLVASATGLTGITSTPFTLAPSHGPFAQVSAGFFHTCGVTVTGSATYCWGNNSNGELGDGTTTSRPRPEIVTGGVTFAAVSAGVNHTCGVTAAGAAYCWGSNINGELGDGTMANRSSPVRVGPTLTFATVSAGFYHTCGVTTAGAAYCWGDNSKGQLGDGSIINHSSPTLVTGSVVFATVSAGGAGFTCGLTAAGGKAYCWGDNSFGALGDGTTFDQLSPVLIADSLTFTAVSAGEFHTCGVTAAAASCWGSNFAGQLGDGTTSTDTLSPVLVVGNMTFATLSLGGDHTCAATAAPVAYCWGYNNLGQLGDGTMTDRSSPTLVTGSVSFATVSAGTLHSCGLTSAGAAYCWGANPTGQLGDGTTATRTTPVPVEP